VARSVRPAASPHVGPSRLLAHQRNLSLQSRSESPISSLFPTHKDKRASPHHHARGAPARDSAASLRALMADDPVISGGTTLPGTTSFTPSVDRRPLAHRTGAAVPSSRWRQASRAESEADDSSAGDEEAMRADRHSKRATPSQSEMSDGEPAGVTLASVLRGRVRKPSIKTDSLSSTSPSKTLLYGRRSSTHRSSLLVRDGQGTPESTPATPGELLVSQRASGQRDRLSLRLSGSVCGGRLPGWPAAALPS
jgi:hypothetical protein